MKKVLILTLGTGESVLNQIESVTKKVDDKERQEVLRNKFQDPSVLTSFNYRKANYCFADHADGKAITTEFVAEVLIKEVKPDYIFILGTVKSCWTNFYLKYSGKLDIEEILALDEMEYSGSDAVRSHELQNNNDIINQIYAQRIGAKLFGEEKIDVELKVVLLRYGIDNAQLRENYQILSDMWKSLDSKETYRVTFDITHSFRSLPIYNLSLLDYQRQIADYDIIIDHVFYGNVELIREKKYAPVVDLVDLVKVMDLSKSVSEFKDVGYSLSLIEQIPEEMNDLKNSLHHFYWGVQMNDVAQISRSINNILANISQSGESGGRYVDLGSMIKSALFDMLESEPENYREIETPEQVYKLNYLIAKWHRKKNRFSNAAVAAFESLKVYLTCLYLDEKRNGADKQLSYAKDFNDNNQKEAYEQFKRRFAQKEILPDKLGKLCQLAEKIRLFRNMSAHMIVKENGKMSVKETVSIVDEFLAKLDCLYTLSEEEAMQFKELYQVRPAKHIVIVSEVPEKTVNEAPRKTVSEVSGETEDEPIDAQSAISKALKEVVSTLIDVNAASNEAPTLEETSGETLPEPAAEQIDINWSEAAIIITDKKLNEEYINSISKRGYSAIFYLDPRAYEVIYSGRRKSYEQWTKASLKLYYYLYHMRIDIDTPIYIDLGRLDSSFYSALVLGFKKWSKVYYSMGDGTFTHVGYIDKKEMPDMGIYRLMFANYLEKDAENKVERISDIPLIQWHN